MKETTLDKSMETSKEIILDKEYVKNMVSTTLNKAHSDPNKRMIREYPDRLNFACPICGDSQKSSHKKRGNLYFKNMYYVCYNDESCNGTFTKLLNTFDIQMDLDKKLHLYEYIENNIKYHAVDNSEITSLDRLIPIEELFEFFKNDTSRNITDLMPLQKNSVVDYYVRHTRKIYGDVDIYQAMFHITPTWKQPVMVFINKMGDKVLSMQVRNLLDGDKRFFKIYDFTKIYDMMHVDNDMDEQEKITYNKLSHFYNIFNVDFTRPITLFEGYIDSLSVPNSIGQVGINTDISFLTKESGIDLKFVYDNDIAGFKKAKRMLLQGHNVFLWNKFFIDLIKMYKGKKNKVQLAKEVSANIKDFNKLSSKFNKPVYKMFDLDKYFSSDDLSVYYFMKLDDLIKMEL